LVALPLIPLVKEGFLRVLFAPELDICLRELWLYKMLEVVALLESKLLLIPLVELIPIEFFHRMCFTSDGIS
jgi:hypothetical protein